VTGSRDSTLRVWNIQKGVMLRVLHGHTASVRCLDICGNKVVSGSYDTTCRVSAITKMKGAFDSDFRLDLGHRYRRMPASTAGSQRSDLLRRNRQESRRLRGNGYNCQVMGHSHRVNNNYSFTKQLLIHSSFAGTVLRNWQATQPSSASCNCPPRPAYLQQAAQTDA
jgi:WD40 repeat protein